MTGCGRLERSQRRCSGKAASRPMTLEHLVSPARSTEWSRLTSVDARCDLPSSGWIGGTERQCSELRHSIDPDRIFAITGLNLDSSHVVPKILWLRAEEPHIYRAARAMLLPGSYIVFHLTGERMVDYSDASSSMLYDVRRKQWSTDMVAATEIDPTLLGRIAPADHVAGTLTPAAARELGLTTRTRVVVGCGDEHGASLGAGLVRPHLICDIVGTAEPVAVTAAAPVFDDTGLVETHAHADARLWLIENPGFVSGGSIRWYCDHIGRMSYPDMAAAATTVAASPSARPPPTSFRATRTGWPTSRRPT